MAEGVAGGEEVVEETHLTFAQERDPNELSSRVRKILALEGHKTINDEDYLGNREGYKIYREQKVANGKFAQYYKARTLKGLDCVVKVLPVANTPIKYKENLNKQGTKILRYIKTHPYDRITSIIDIYMAKSKLYVFCEQLGTDLEKLCKKTPCKEPEIKVWVSDILKGLQYLYENAISHRHIVAGNVVLTADKSHAKLTGFGQAMLTWDPEKQTPIYMEKEKEFHYHCPPETIKDAFDGHIADIWGVGCIISNLMTKRYCFDKKTKDYVNGFKTHFRRYEVPITADLDCFLTRIFVVEPADRASIGELLHHHWFGGECPHGAH